MTSTPAIELKPCPFCGSPAQSTQWTGRMADDCFPHYSIHCTNGEDCWGSNHAHLGSDLAETVAAWNRRPLDSADGVEVRALAWQRENVDGTFWTGAAPFSGQYDVKHGAKGWEAGRGMGRIGWFETCAAAKAACQSDFDQRVRSALK
jgi:hypothetical protein